MTEKLFTGTLRISQPTNHISSFCRKSEHIFYSQTQKLVRERLGDSLRVEDYTVGKCLVASYWRYALCFNRFFLVFEKQLPIVAFYVLIYKVSVEEIRCVFDDN